MANILRENNRFNDTLARIEQAAPEAERQIIQKIRAAQEEAMTVVADIANLVRDGKIDAATRLQITREDPLYRSIDALVALVVQHENDRMAALRAGIGADNRRSLVVMGGFAAASVLFALVGHLLSGRPAFAPLVPAVLETAVALALVLVAAAVSAIVARRLSNALTSPALLA